MYNSSVKKKGVPLPENVFQKQFFSNRSLGDVFRLSKMFYNLKIYNIHFGINIENRKQVIITSTKIKNIEQVVKTQIFDHVTYFSPIWSSLQIINKQEFRFQVYEKKGCSLAQYIQTVHEIKLKNIHIMLYSLIELLIQMHNAKINFKQFDFKTIIVCDTSSQGPEFTLQNLLCSINRKNKIVKSEKAFIKQSEKLNILHKKQKNVTFNLNTKTNSYSNKKDIREVSVQLWNLLEQVAWPSTKKQSEQLKELQSLIFLMGRQSAEIGNQDIHSIQLLLKIKQYHKMLIKKYGINIKSELLEMKKTCEKLKKRRENMIVKLIDQMESQLQIIDEKDSLDCQQDCISKSVQSHIFQVKPIWKINYQQQNRTNQISQKKIQKYKGLEQNINKNQVKENIHNMRNA